MPTRSGFAALGLAVILVIAARLFGIFEFYIVAVAIVALVGCAVAWVTLNWRSLQVARVLEPGRLHAGSDSVVTLTLSNRRVIPTPVAQVTDSVAGETRADAHVPPLVRGRSTRASYRLDTDRRGRFPIGPMTTRITDPFGFASSTRQSAPDAALLVLPSYDHIAPPPPPGGLLATQVNGTPGRIGANGDEFSALRPYVVGDDLRKVHWPSTARRNDLVVRIEQLPEEGHSLVVLDVRAPVAAPETFERMVSATTSVVLACRARGDELRFMTTAGDDLYVRTSGEHEALLDRLALVEQLASDSATLATPASSSNVESAVMIVGLDATIVQHVRRTHQLPAGAISVQFTPSGASPSFDPDAVRSQRMMTVGPLDDFAGLWTSLVGAVAPRQRAQS